MTTQHILSPKLLTNLFGTDGIRGNASHAPYLQDDFLLILGQTLVAWAHQSDAEPRFLIAHDSRSSSRRIQNALRRGIAAAGGQTIIAGMLPSPALISIVRQAATYAAGIMITASHNAAADNGIKFCSNRGKITTDDEQQLRLLLSKHTITTCKLLPLPRLKQLPKHQLTSYVTGLLELMPSRALAGLTIVLDCANGATSQLAENLFTAAGASVHVYANTPSGTNINDRCGSTYPTYLQDLVQKHRAHVGFAFDGDGDRVLAINPEGHVKEGDDLLALLLTHPRFSAAPALVGTSMSNEGLANHVRTLGKTFIRTSVGDKYVMATLKQLKLPLGGEPSGHILFPELMPGADGMATALLVAHAIVLTKNYHLTTFTPFAQTTINLPCTTKHDLTKGIYARILEDVTSQLGAGRCVVRYSGTEPVLRIMVEHPEQHKAVSFAQQLAEQLRPHLTVHTQSMENLHAIPAL